jgi:hypothetical protein
LIVNEPIEHFFAGIAIGLDAYRENSHVRGIRVERAAPISGKAVVYCLIVALWGAIMFGMALAALVG